VHKIDIAPSDNPAQLPGYVGYVQKKGDQTPRFEHAASNYTELGLD
jgi:hypothetical protein